MQSAGTNATTRLLAAETDVAAIGDPQVPSVEPVLQPAGAATVAAARALLAAHLVRQAHVGEVAAVTDAETS